MGKKRSMFYKKPKHRKLAEVVSLESPRKAKKSAHTLLKMFKNAKTRKEKRTIKQATVLAANRAKAAKKRKHLSRREREQYAEEADIYVEAYQEMEL